ncbi:MAG: hypothetical protein V4487_04405 [Chlamydiota bacterium]
MKLWLLLSLCLFLNSCGSGGSSYNNRGYVISQTELENESEPLDVDPY